MNSCSVGTIHNRDQQEQARQYRVSYTSPGDTILASIHIIHSIDDTVLHHITETKFEETYRLYTIIPIFQFKNLSSLCNSEGIVKLIHRLSRHGFGLHTSAIAVKELGGQITVHNEGIEKGVTFTVELPLKSVVVKGIEV